MDWLHNLHLIQRLWLIGSPWGLPSLPLPLLLDLPRDVIRSVARFRLRAHTLRIETVTWTHNTSPTCVMLVMYRMSNTPFPLHPSTRCLSPKDLCFPFFFRRLKQCVCFSGPGKQ